MPCGCLSKERILLITAAGVLSNVDSQLGLSRAFVVFAFYAGTFQRSSRICFLCKDLLELQSSLLFYERTLLFKIGLS